MKNSRLLLPLGLALVMLPTALLLPGCSGGSSGVSRPSIPSSLSTTFALENNKTGQLDLALDGRTVAGQFIVAAATATPTAQVNLKKVQSGSVKPSAAFDLPVGSYPASGTYSPPRGYSLTTTLPAPVGAIEISGQIPLARRGGTFTVTQTSTGEKFSGTLPPLNSISPTATATATATGTATATATASPSASATAAPTPTNNSLNLTFSSVTGVPGGTDTSPFQVGTAKFDSFSNNPQFIVTSSFETTAGGVNRQISFEGPLLSRPVASGDVLNLSTAQRAAEGILYYSEDRGGTILSWESTGGQMRIDSATASSVTFTLSGVQMRPAFNANGATGNFTLGGSGSLVD